MNPMYPYTITTVHHQIVVSTTGDLPKTSSSQSLDLYRSSTINLYNNKSRCPATTNKTPGHGATNTHTLNKPPIIVHQDTKEATMVFPIFLAMDGDRQQHQPVVLYPKPQTDNTKTPF